MKTNENKTVFYKMNTDSGEIDTLIYINFQKIKTNVYTKIMKIPLGAARPQYPKYIKYPPGFFHKWKNLN